MRLLSSEETIEFLSYFYDFTGTTLSVEIVKICNLSCPGCWANLQDRKSNSIADIETLEMFLKFGRNVGIENISFLGGEPTLHPRLSEIIKMAHSLGYAGISLTTNGVFPSEKMEEIATSGLNNISFSIDSSSPEIHEKIRPSLIGKNTFAAVVGNLMKAVDYSKKYGFDVRVNHTIFPNNFYDATSMIRFVTDVGIKKIRIHFAFPGDEHLRSNNKIQMSENYNYISPNDWLSLYRKCTELSKQLEVEISIKPVYGIQEVNKAQIIKPPYLQVQSNGNLVMCNTHMRLADEHQHSFGIIVNENCIMLNEDCIIFDESPKGTCCKAIPKLLLNLPEALRTQINEVGGMGCIYLPGPLFKRGQQ